jgi:hypothetical protein
MTYKIGDKIRKFEYLLNQLVVARVVEYLGYGIKYHSTEQTRSYECSLWFPFYDHFIKCRDVSDAKERLRQYIGDEAFDLVKEHNVVSLDTVKEVEV